MKRNTVAMTLFETMIAICVATLLFVSLASSFYMFRVLNKNTIRNSKKELSMLAIRNYIESNTDRILLYKIGGTCMYVDVDELAPSYELINYDKSFYLVDTTHVGDFMHNHGLGSEADVGHFDDIGLFDENDDPIVNINGDYIVRFDTEEYTNEDSRFYIVSFDEDGNEKTSPIFKFTDKGRGYSNPIGESLYYSEEAGSVREATLPVGSNIFDSLLNGTFTFRETTSTINDDGKTEYVKTKALYETIEGEEVKIFDNLPYETLNVNYSVDKNIYSVVDENGTLVPTYGIDIKTVCLEQDEDGNEIYTESKDFGVAYVYDSNFDIGEVYCQAKQILFTGRDLKDKTNPLNINKNEVLEDLKDNKTIKKFNDILNETKYTYEFVGWKIEGEEDKTDPNITVSIPVKQDGHLSERKTVTAVFEKKVVPFSGDEDEDTIDYTLRYTFGTKYTYVVACNIEYSEANDSGSFDDRKISFVTGVYYKYEPQAYTGEENN